MIVNSWAAERLAASQEGISSMELRRNEMNQEELKMERSNDGVGIFKLKGCNIMEICFITSQKGLLHAHRRKNLGPHV
jgi:hypothetical protein